MEIVCLDLEGVLVPEIWINFAERTGIDELRATTRDIPDYDQLMAQRLAILDQHDLGIEDIQKVIATMAPMEGALEFVESLRTRYQVVILSDTFYEFAKPLMAQLNWPTLFCHRLHVENARISGYTLRMADHKRAAVMAFKTLNFKVFAAGDSYNDTAMLEEAELGVLFQAPDNVIAEFPHLPLSHSYQELSEIFEKAKAG
ncbi:MAG: bifunctional phosphoserine phosphatase/homoserine phosphotransferase ThrH [Rhodospirillaceae bacterium]|nr:bifunctional phosphoserine phosphatase/homoserine phosphotransferase ThrH [Rhodospirillaceae bacterium]MBT5245394.1 bifunctional phosphoserine phosphatase/homoserine phosphotransferase ThrH [Rhodospirillaceae bacterium]MBT5562550.1 bifunctional phosphoserine phosphatase/homoserine phosphotransferase ThrH [Rhodospirillaceae bacterium]MBT6242877.1 bifunctional phosphoserine phosphatase/homoserine phosphotransferase ThrH [Rhodospirillaceae bacterium]